MYTKALEFAIAAHAGQVRKRYGLPYHVHLTSVVAVLRHAGCYDENILCAAVLHDTIEDTNTTHIQLAEVFGKSIADLVLELTNSGIDEIEKQIAEKNPELPPKEVRALAKQQYTRTTMEKRSDAAFMIKCADLIDNCIDFLNTGEPAEKKQMQERIKQVISVYDNRKFTEFEPIIKKLIQHLHELAYGSQL